MNASSLLLSVVTLLSPLSMPVDTDLSAGGAAAPAPVRPDDPVPPAIKNLQSPWGYWGTYEVHYGYNDLVCTGTNRHFPFYYWG